MGRRETPLIIRDIRSAGTPALQVIQGRLPDGKVLLAVRVVPFRDQPLVCIKSINDNKGSVVIRTGALYIRSGTQTKEITSEAEMRELLGRAYVKRAEQVLSDIKALIDEHWAGAKTSPTVEVLAAIDRDLASMKRP